MKNKPPYCNIQSVFHLSAKLVTFLHLKTKFCCYFVLALFTNFTAVAVVLPILAELDFILRSECGNTWKKS